MRIALPLLALISLTAGTLAVSAQEDRDPQFRKAMAACADAGILAARSKVEAGLDAAAAGAAAEAERMMEEGLAACGRGNLAVAKREMAEAVEVLATFSAPAEAKAKKLAAEPVTPAATAPAAVAKTASEPAPAAAPDAAGDASEAEEVPWWQFW